MNFTNSRDVWKSLEKQFRSQSHAKALNLKLQLNSTRKGSMSITDYFLKMKSLRVSLAAAGSLISDYDFILHVLLGLNSDYNDAAAYITGRTCDDAMDIEDAYSMLLNQEARLQRDFLIADNVHRTTLRLILLKTEQTLKDECTIVTEVVTVVMVLPDLMIKEIGTCQEVLEINLQQQPQFGPVMSQGSYWNQVGKGKGIVNQTYFGNNAKFNGAVGGAQATGSNNSSKPTC